jgi:hypothetical protein
MDVEELDLTIVEATAGYRPVHDNGTERVDSERVDSERVDAGDAEVVPDADLRMPRPEAGPVEAPGDVGGAGSERSLLESRVAQLEADLENWQRRAATWRERALSAQALNEALNRNLEDLRMALQALATAPTHAPESTESSVPATPHAERPVATATMVEWCNKVFRRSFWTGPR